MKHQTAEQAAIISNPKGDYFRVDYCYNGKIGYHDEDSGQEFESKIHELEGWAAYKLVQIKE
jgi:hypothetical protein